MIDADVLLDNLDEGMVNDALSEYEAQNPQYSGIMPRTKVALGFTEIIVRYLVETVEEVALGFCHCLAPIFPQTLEEGSCVVCGNSISILLGRNT